ECLAGVLPAEGGAVLRDGQSMSPRERCRTFFYMPDGIAPWPQQTVRWALAYAAGFFAPGHFFPSLFFPGLTVTEQSDSFGLDACGLTPLLDARIGELSKGQRKRVLLAIGLLTPAPILLADEPFDGLDLKQTREIGAGLRSLASQGRTLFLSIHQISDAARFCDRFLLLSAGRLCGQGTLADLTHDTHTDNLEDAFLALT